MDRDSFGLTEEDYGYDDDDEAFEQYGLFTSPAMFSGTGYRGYSGADIATKPSMAAMANSEPQGTLMMSPEMAMEMSIVAMEEAAYGDVEDEFDGLPGQDGKKREVYDVNGGMVDDFWGDEDEDALLFGFGEF